MTWTGTGVTVFDTIGGSAAYSATQFRWVAVGGFIYGAATSADGITWTQLGTPWSVGRGVAFSASQSRWVAVGDQRSGFSHTIGTSTTGLVWTGLGNSVFTSGLGVAFATAQSLWVAVGEGTNTIAKSSDGVTWTGLGTSVFSTRGNAVAFSETQSRWVAVGQGGNTLAHSSDGTTWTPHGTTPFAVLGSGVAFAAPLSRWVAVGFGGVGGNVMATSSDGITWTGLGDALFGSSGAGKAVAFSPTQMKWIAVGTGNPTMLNSSDGTTWTPIPSSLSVNSLCTGIAVGDVSPPPSTTLTSSGSGGTTAPAQGGGATPCFHKTTVITYKGADFSLSQLLADHAHECVVPHVVVTHGIAITAYCEQEEHVLRVTPGHLVYTQRGLVAAADVTHSDTLYSNMEKTRACHVLKVDRDTATAEYFGLNCYTSDVLASGIKTSTFEKLHTLPSLWFSIAGRILGIQRASSIGDRLAHLVAKWL